MQNTSDNGKPWTYVIAVVVAALVIGGVAWGAALLRNSPTPCLTCTSHTPTPAPPSRTPTPIYPTEVPTHPAPLPTSKPTLPPPLPTAPTPQSTAVAVIVAGLCVHVTPGWICADNSGTPTPAYNSP